MKYYIWAAIILFIYWIVVELFDVWLLHKNQIWKAWIQTANKYPVPDLNIKGKKLLRKVWIRFPGKTPYGSCYRSLTIYHKGILLYDSISLFLPVKRAFIPWSCLSIPMEKKIIFLGKVYEIAIKDVDLKLLIPKRYLKYFEKH